jgi:acyl-CoA thioesterase I
MESSCAALALALLLGCGGGGVDGADKSTADAGATGTWVVLGSSTAAGVGAGTGQGWASLLAGGNAAQGRQIDNRARSGAVTYQALPATAPRPAGRPATVATMDIDTVVASQPKLIILAFPSNDAMAGYTAAETSENLLALRQRAVDAAIQVLVLSSQPRDDADAAQRQSMLTVDQSLAGAAGSCFLNVREPLSDAEGRIAAAYSAGDGVHFNDAGHRRIFEIVSATLSAGRCNPFDRG